MSKSSSKQKKPDLGNYDPLAPQSRRAFAIALITILVAGVELIHYSYLVLTRGLWQIIFIVGALCFLIVVSILALLASRKGNAILSGWLLIGGVFTVLASVSLVLENVSNLVGLAGLFTIVYIAIQTLPQERVRWAVFLGVFLLVVTNLMVAYPTIEKIQIRSLERIVQGTSAIALITLGAMLLVQFRALALTNKLMVSFLVVSVVMAYSLGAYSNRITEQALTERVGQSLNDMATSQAQAIGGVLNSQLDSLVSLSLGSYLQTWVRSANDLYEKEPTKIMVVQNRLDRQWKEAVRAGDLNNPVIVKRMQNPIAKDLKGYSDVFPANLEVLLTDVYGGLLASTGLEPDYYQGDEYWWQSAYNKRSGAMYISPPIYDSDKKQNVLVMAIPVRDQDTGGVMGVLRTTYSLEEIEKHLTPEGKSVGAGLDLYIPSQPPQVIQSGLLQAAEPEIIERLKALSPSPYGEISYHETDSFVSQAPVRPASANPTISDLGWWLVAYQDKAVLLAPVRRQSQQTGFLSAIILGVVAGAAVLVSQYLSGPIVRLTRIAERVASGELSARAELESEDEVGILAMTFNRMTSQLRETLQSLEHRVSERTRELALAGEVGRKISQERDLDRLLGEAVDMIQSSFSLYYTQLYLVDPSGRALILRSGFGEVGEELIRRGHRLPIAPGSINGLAALERRPIVVSDTLTSPYFRSNPLLPKTRSEMAVPLLVGDRLVGVLDMQSERPDTFRKDSLPAFEALAGQLAIAVENATLFREAEQARAELESQTRRLTRAGWKEYLDAIQRAEVIGFAYDRQEIYPISQPPTEIHSKNALIFPLQISGGEIGELWLEKESEGDWSEDEVSLVNAVAAQAIRQIENIRLLTQAEKYREEAEQAVRRLTREGWAEFGRSLRKEALGYVYDHQRVLPDQNGGNGNDGSAVLQPISLRGEELGLLELAGVSLKDSDTLDFIREITERLSAHVENLRLTAQTQSALLETEALYSIIARINSAKGYKDILDLFAEETGFERADQLLLLGLFDKPLHSEQVPEWIIPVAARSSTEIEIGRRYPFSIFEGKPEELLSAKPVVFIDLTPARRVNLGTGPLFRLVYKAKCSYILPFKLGGQVIGFIQGYFSQMTEFHTDELQRLDAVGGQAALAVQSILLLERAQANARQEQRIREASAQIYSAVDVESVMQKAVQQVGKVLGAKAYIYLGEPSATVEKK